MSPRVISEILSRILVALLAISAPAGAQAPTPTATAHQDALPRTTPEAARLDARGLDEAEALLETFVRDGKIAGAVAAVVRGGRLAWLRAVGVQDLSTGTPMTERSIFRIYSMTKSVTAVAVMMLHEQGAFELDDPVSRWLPELGEVRVLVEGEGPRPPVRPITVADLLLHTSGLSHRTSELYRQERVRSRSDSLPRFVANIARAPLMEDPGTRFRYSEATTVLGRLVEVWSGQPLDVFLQERILGPLGMVDTGFWVRPEQRARLAAVYGPAPGGGLVPVEIEEVPFTVRPALLEGAVGLVSTVPDFLRFSQMLLDGGELDGVRLLAAETVARMTRNGLPEGILAARGGSVGWGLAQVNVVMDPAGVRYPASAGEYGWDGTAGTIFWIDPARETVIVLMTQSSPPNPDMLRQRFKTLVQGAVLD